MDKKSLEQDQARDCIQEKIKRTEKERPIHIQIRNGNTQQGKIKGDSGKMERTPIRYWTYGEIFPVAILH